MAGQIKTDGPELALQKIIITEVLKSGLDVRATVSVIANVLAGIIGMTNAPADKVLRLVSETVTARLSCEREPEGEKA